MKERKMNSAVPSQPSAETAFTLTELLVILATVGLFGLTMVSAMTRTQDASHRALCTYNLKHLMGATLLYAKENRDYMPWPNWGLTAKGWLFDPKTTPHPVRPNGLIWPYTQDASLYRCTLDFTNGPNWGNRDNKASTYVMNGAVCGYSLVKTYKVSDFNPSALMLWEPDENANQFAYSDASIYPNMWSVVSPRHGTNGPLAAIDGSVVWMDAATIKAEQMRKPGRFWGNPGSASGM